jgi:hypothetical protein
MMKVDRITMVILGLALSNIVRAQEGPVSP